MNLRLLFTAFVIALTTSFSAVAVEDMSKGMDAGKEIVVQADKSDMAAQPIKSEFKGHDHNAVHKQGAPRMGPSEAAGIAKKPLHDHMKVHKQR